jgi:hypothetical protein
VVAEANPFKSTVSGDHTQLRALVAKSAKEGSKFKIIKFQVRKVFGIGAVTLAFNSRKLPAAQAVFLNGSRLVNDLTVPTLMKGYALLNRTTEHTKRVPAALSVINGKVRVQFSTLQESPQAPSPRLYSITWGLSKNESEAARVAIKQNSMLQGKLCGTHASKPGEVRAQLSSSEGPTVVRPTTKARIITLATDADHEWYKKYGASSNAEIAALLNAAEAIFERDLGIRFALVRQHVYTGESPYVSSDSTELLTSFARNPANPANLGFSPLTYDEDVDGKYLFTGKDLIGNVVGLSYVGAICWSSKNAYGLIQDTTPELNITTFMHELGHTLGASHDATDAVGIMYPNLSIKRRFSAISTEQINRSLAINGKCVAEELVGANLANATLTLRQRLAKDRRSLLLTGTLVSNLSQPLPGEMVKLTLNKKIVFATTDAKGAFSYRVKLSGLKVKRLTVFAQTLNNETSIPGAIKVQVRA